MKKINIYIILFILLSPFLSIAQGLDGIVVEKYYSTNAADGANATSQGAVTPLVTGSTVYRVYVDMAAGYKFSTLYGNAAHNLSVNTTTNFYNDPNYGVAVNPGTISLTNIARHTALIDSWFTTGGTCIGKAGVLKTDDTDGSVGNVQNVLANNPGACFGLNITGAGSQDGMLPSTALTQVTPNTLGLGVGNALLSALDQTAGNSVIITNGSIAALGGVVGPNASNRVLVGQFTTNGVFTFSLNVQIINTSTNVAENYVASSPSASEFTHPSLTRAANTPPIVSITSPSNASTHVVGSSIVIDAAASDNGTISSVAFFVDGNLLSTDVTSPYSATYVGVLGSHVLTAVATDNDCASTTSGAVNITVAAGIPPPANDNITSSILIPSANSFYPHCTQYTGTLANSTNSAQSVAVGPDNWYRFVAASTGVSIEMTGATMNNVIELVRETSPSVYTIVETENANPNTGALERLNFNGLIIGTTYYVGCGSATAGPGGAFSVCVKQLAMSSCGTNTSIPLNSCSSFKPLWTGANSYVITFAPQSGSAGGGTVTSPGSTSLGNPLYNLIPGNTYNVNVNAVYNLTDNAPTPVAEIITVSGANPSCSNVVIATTPGIEVRASQRCSVPATLLAATILRTDPLVCGVTNYTFRFTPVTSCLDNTPTGTSFTVSSVSRNIALNFPGTATTPSGQTIQNQTYYRVEVRPSFGANQGTFGPAQTIFIGGVLGMATVAPSTEQVWNERSAIEDDFAFGVYPNPTNNLGINLFVENALSNTIGLQIFDMQGRVVCSKQLIAEGSLQTYISFDNYLPTGVYNVQLQSGNKVLNERMIIQN
jgi:hypothetical protein